jgi:hypothetical protein
MINRIFLDSCTVQTLRGYGGFIFEAEPIGALDRIRNVTDGVQNIEALGNIFLFSERALFDWIVSSGSIEEGWAKRDAGHLQWLHNIADHSAVCLEENGGSTSESAALALRLNEPKFGYLHEGQAAPTRRGRARL